MMGAASRRAMMATKAFLGRYFASRRDDGFTRFFMGVARVRDDARFAYFRHL